MSLASLAWMVRRLARPDGSAGKLAAFAFLKLPLMAGLLALVVWLSSGSLRALGGVLLGVALVPVVIVLKVIGISLAGPGSE